MRCFLLRCHFFHLSDRFLSFRCVGLLFALPLCCNDRLRGGHGRVALGPCLAGCCDGRSFDVKQDVWLLSHGVPRTTRGDPAVVKLVPLAPGAPEEAVIVATVHAKPVMDQDPVQVIDCRAFGLCVAHEWRQVDRLVKVDVLGDFPPGTAKLESLQLDDEGIGRSFDAHSLDRFDHLVLLRTLVAVLAVEHLTCRESLQGPLNAVRP
mmetsp:Transcript_9071/g.24432  ORF Transcript_9071/g.24432 Transcript_9071/m.24432 type:complete len:207 (-) Transcript_9071:259-879(-)